VYVGAEVRADDTGQASTVDGLRKLRHPLAHSARRLVRAMSSRSRKVELLAPVDREVDVARGAALGATKPGTQVFPRLVG
jgi:hypothetical protein